MHLVRSEGSWHNDGITINKTPVFARDMYVAGIKTVKDIVAINGRILNVDNIKRHYPTVTTIFLTIQSSLGVFFPRERRKVLRQFDSD